MPDALAVSPPVTPPSPPKSEKAPADKPQAAAADKDEGREFSAVLDQAVEGPQVDTATIDVAVAMTASQGVGIAAGDPAAAGGELGTGGTPSTDGRRPATLRPLRPEARAALHNAMPEAATGKVASDGQAPAPFDTALNRQGDDETPDQRVENLTAPGKPLGMTDERAVTQLAKPEIGAETAQATPPPSAAEAARREQPPTLKLDTHLPVHSPRFAEGFTQQVVVLAQHGIQQAQMSLTPPALGPIDVRITVNNDEATVQIAAHSGAARDAIQDALPRLKDMLEQSGVRLSDASVFAQLPQRDHSAAAQQRADWWQQEQQVNGASGGDEEELSVPIRVLHPGLIDAYA